MHSTGGRLQFLFADHEGRLNQYKGNEHQKLGSMSHSVLLQVAATPSENRRELITGHSTKDILQGALEGYFKESKAKVLLVEDNPINQKVAFGILQKIGLTTEVVGNGQEAVDAVKRERYDLIFMDVQMPVMDGLQATRLIRKEEQRTTNTKHTPIIAMTANVMQGDRELCRKAGMDDYISKPVSPLQICHTLEKWLSKERKA